MARLLGIGFIWLGCAVAWLILGGTIVDRSGSSSSSLLSEVYGLWGPPVSQPSPFASYPETRIEKQKVTTTDAAGHAIEREELKEVPYAVPVPLDGTLVAAHLSLQQRQKGLLWFPTYTLGLEAHYTFTNPDARPRTVDVQLPLDQENAIYDAFEVLDEKGASVPAQFGPGGANWQVPFGAKQVRQFTVSYRTRGTGSWRYPMTQGTGQVRNFKLALDTDFPEVDFPVGTLSPTRQAVTAGKWHGEWEFKSLVAQGVIGLGLPQKLNPGDLASKITFFAPVGLLFFFFVVAVLAAAARREIHPLHYFLIGCAFFAFHLLFAYLVDQLPVGTAFAIASAVSVFLVVSYARLFVGWRFALREMAIAQLIYLVLFSFTFFWTGFTGLAITLGAIVTLFVIMQITGRVDWKQMGSQPKGMGSGLPVST